MAILAAGPSLSLWEATVRILLAMLLAGAVGVERELRDQEAGLRTHILVGVGAALFVVVGNFSWRELSFGNQVGVVLDPSRVVAYVITGIGFLGAGTIIKHGTSVRGLTTAASLWVVAAVGVAAGSGDYAIAAVAAGAVLLSLWPVRRLAQAMGLRRSAASRLTAQVESGTPIGRVVAALETAPVRVESVRVAEEAGLRTVEAVVVGHAPDVRDALDALARVDGVREATLAP